MTAVAGGGGYDRARDDDGRGLLGVIEGKGENERKQHEFEHKYS